MTVCKLGIGKEGNVVLLLLNNKSNDERIYV
jgi:hypothetical protein